MSTVVLLGPQSRRPTLRAALDELGVEGPLAAVTAGWEEREEEVEALQGHLDRDVENLLLYRRSESLFASDPEFFAAYRRRRVAIRELQSLYRVRLTHLMEADEDLATQPVAAGLVAQERDSVLESIRALDAHHARRLRDIQRGFDKVARAPHPLLTRQRREIRDAIAGASAVLVAGGHVAVLLNRLRLYGLAPLLRAKTVVAWSAGALAVAETPVLFYDDPPHGQGHPEVFGPGLGLCRGVVPLPDAGRRLRLDDPARVVRFARRFAPSLCAVLDDGAGLSWDGRAFHPIAGGYRRLTPDGLRAGDDAA